MQIITDISKISKTVQRNLIFFLNVLWESSIHFTHLSIVLTKKNIGIFKKKWFWSKNNTYWSQVLFKNLCFRIKEMRNSYFLKFRQLMSLHFFSLNNPKILTKGTFHRLQLITIVLSYLKIFSLKKAFTYFSQYFRESASKSKSTDCILERLELHELQWWFILLSLILNFPKMEP